MTGSCFECRKICVGEFCVADLIIIFKIYVSPSWPSSLTGREKFHKITPNVPKYTNIILQQPQYQFHTNLHKENIHSKPCQQ
jgi:hypothetical protein